MFGLIPRDIGRPAHELEIYYRPADLRPLIEQAYAERRTITLQSVERNLPGADPQYVDVHVSPLTEDGGTELGVSVSYVDITHYVKLQEELQHSTQELETASEELQSTNEELHTVNEEMRQRTDELNNVNGFLNSIMSSMRAAMVVLDSDFIVLIWNLKAENLWGLRAQEVRGKSFMSLDIGLPVEELRKPMRACITGEGEYQQTVVDAVNRRGRKIKCSVTCSRLVNEPKRDAGVVLLMEEID